MNILAKHGSKLLVSGVILSFMAFICPQLAHAASPSDYDYGISIDVREQGAFYRFILTDTVHQRLKRPDMRDLFLFDANGNAVPFIVKTELKQKADTIRKSIPFFPIYTKNKIRPEEFRLDISTAGSRVKVYSPTGGTENGQTLSGYLLDLRSFSQKPHTLHFSWEQKENNFAVPLNISMGSDLLHWTSYTGVGTIAEFHQGDKILRQNAIELAAFANAEKYLLISWQGGNPPPALTRIEGSTSTISPHPPETRLISANPAASLRGEYLYDLGGIYPLVSINLEVENGYYPGAIVYSRSGDLAEWREITRTDFYRVKIKGQEIRNPALQITGHNERFWRVLISQDLAPANIPDLKMNWTPVEVRFLAQGTPPFLLAFGSNSPGESPSGGLFSRVSVEETDLNTITLGEAHKRASSPKPEKEVPINWGSWLLWGLLSAAVLMLTGMAWKLVKNLKQDR